MSVKGEKIHQFCKISALIGVFFRFNRLFSALIEAVFVVILPRRGYLLMEKLVFCHHPAP